MRHLLVLCVLAGCSSVSPDEKACRANIASTLINPETAEYHDYRPVDAATYGSAMMAYFWKARGIPEQDRYKYVSQVEGATRDLMKSFTDRGATFSTVRVRVEGQLGNKITATYACTVVTDGCSCAG